MGIPDDYKAWYKKRTGREPKDMSEVQILYQREFLDLNPRVRKERDLIVEYAESKGGVVLEFLRRFLAEDFLLPRIVPPDQAGRSLGLTEEQEEQIWLEMMEHVRPAFEASPEYKLPRDQDQLRFPSIREGHKKGGPHLAS